MSTVHLADALNQTADLLELIESDPLKAADLLEIWAKDLQETAVKLRQANRPNYPDLASVGGTNDRVYARVIGSDGRVRQTGGN